MLHVLDSLLRSLKVIALFSFQISVHYSNILNIWCITIGSNKGCKSRCCWDCCLQPWRSPAWLCSCYYYCSGRGGALSLLFSKRKTVSTLYSISLLVCKTRILRFSCRHIASFCFYIYRESMQVVISLQDILNITICRNY